ncbi:MAG TPA: TPM domain-containing protein [Caulobacteraceae bacterium]|jgi:putative membrane protein
MLNTIDQDRIAEAVSKAEEGTSGEIVCVLAGEVSHYPEVAIAYAALAALVIPPLALALGLRPLAAISDAGVWMAAQAGALESEFSLGLGIYAAAQALLFILAFLILEIPAVRRAVTPNPLKRHRVERSAHQQFASIAARAEGSQTGVLIFVALEDHQVQILADKGIHDRVGDPVWNKAAGAIGRAMKGGQDPTSGIVEAISICGEALRAHFPAAGPHAPVFSNRPLEI